MRTGTANLPLHGGKCPPWLFNRMKTLSGAILEVIVLEYGAEEVLRRLSDPYWFQAFGCILGYDWHSSGLTTTVCGAVKEALKYKQGELGIFIAGGKGKSSTRTPQEIEEYGERFALLNEAEKYVYASRMTAKVDNTAVQDGYQLYHHVFIFTREGSWGVIQQGLNEDNRYARRYHWLYNKDLDFVNEPHTAICCDDRKQALNMTAATSRENRDAAAALSREKPERVISEFEKLKGSKELHLSAAHGIPQAKNLERALIKAYEKHPPGFEQLLSVRGVGPKTVRALSLVSELAYGVKASYRDPVRYSFAHGGKDGTPYPVDRSNYERTIEVLQKSVEDAKIGNKDKLDMLRKLSRFS